MTDKIPMKRCGTLEEIAALVSFIASKEVPYSLYSPSWLIYRCVQIHGSQTMALLFLNC